MALAGGGMLHLVRLEILTNMGKFGTGMLRQIMIYFFSSDEEAMAHGEKVGRRMWLEIYGEY